MRVVISISGTPDGTGSAARAPILAKALSWCIAETGYRTPHVTSRKHFATGISLDREGADVSPP